MKTTDYLFWSVMIFFAIFYLMVGNDLYKEKYEMIDEKREQLQSISDENNRKLTNQ